jgi:nitrous oxidase accessory protein
VIRVSRTAIFVVLVLMWPLTAMAEAPSLQDLIDQSPPNGILVPPPGVYNGPITLDFPLTIDGQGLVTIDAGGLGTVVYLDTDGATIKNMRLTNSGDRHNDLDAGVQIRGNFNVVKDCVIDDCLFGIDLKQSEYNIVRRNTISSKPFALGQRGDGIRLWYSFHNKIQDNVCRDVRDMVVWYSGDNEITGNRSTNSRYSLHFMYSRFNLVENNWFYGNAVGIFLMYSDGVVVRGNHILHAAGPTGIGIGFKETSDLLIEDNEILYCASGLYIDLSPFQPDTTNRFFNNTIAYNGIGIRFLNDWAGNIFHDNQIADNMTQILVGGGDSANRNEWKGNYWSDYRGFDRDGNGVGDTPYEIYSFADSIWKDSPYAQFFKGSPLLETLDFLERLAPFTEPQLLVRDEEPKLNKEEAGTDRASRSVAAPLTGMPK